MSVARYYKIEQEKLLLEFEKIALFTKHNTTLGSYREAILRSYVQKICPPSLTIKSGFVSPAGEKGHITESQSRQIDCLIFDKSKWLPHLEEDDFAVIRPESLCGALEVKSTLSLYKKRDESLKQATDIFPFCDTDGFFYRWEGTLIDAFTNIRCAADASQNDIKAHFSGIFSYTSEFEIRTLQQALKRQEIQDQLSFEHMRQLPMYICVPGKFLICFAPTDIFDAALAECSGNPFETWFNVILPTKDSSEVPLQIFTTFLHNQLSYWLTKQSPLLTGLFSFAPTEVSHISERFILSSK